MQNEKEFWQEESFGQRFYGSLTATAKGWFFVVLFMMIFGGFYIGFWISCNAIERPLDVPHVTSDSYYENKAAAEAAARDIFGDDGIMTVLLLGCDRRGNDVGRTDTIMVAFINNQNDNVGLLSIPRDTYVQIGNSTTKTKINHSYAYGGVELMQKSAENLLGIEIDRYVMVDFTGFAAIIDALGGIDYEVEKDMYRPEESIDLKAGWQHLDGKAALAYVRWRGDAMADIGRVNRQQKFLKALAADMFKVGTIFKLPKMIGALNEYLETDFTLSELVSMAELFKDALSLELRTEYVPGDGTYINGISYWVPFENQLADLVEEMMTIPVEQEPVAANPQGTAPVTN